MNRPIHLLAKYNVACSIVRRFTSGNATTSRDLVTCKRCLQVIARLERLEQKKRSPEK